MFYPYHQVYFHFKGKTGNMKKRWICIWEWNNHIFSLKSWIYDHPRYRKMPLQVFVWLYFEAALSWWLFITICRLGFSIYFDKCKSEYIKAHKKNYSKAENPLCVISNFIMTACQQLPPGSHKCEFTLHCLPECTYCLGVRRINLIGKFSSTEFINKMQKP